MPKMSLPTFPKFDIHSDENSVGIRWTKYVNQLENLFVAMDISSKKRKKALLLHYAGEDVFDIHQTLPDTSAEDGYDQSKTALTNYFQPQVNREFEVFAFRQMKQLQEETVDQFATGLRQKSKHCDFADNDGEIKSQIIQGCTSNDLRRKALRDNLDLTKLLSTARAMEIANKQADKMRKSEETNAVRQKLFLSLTLSNLLLKAKKEKSKNVGTVEDAIHIAHHVLRLAKSVITAKSENPEKELTEEYRDVFEGFGKLKDKRIKIHIDENIAPVAEPHRRIPFHVRNKVEEELKRLEQQDVIEKAVGPTPWVSPIVVAPRAKNPNQIRICVDMRKANKAIKRERHLTPTIDDLIMDLNGAKVFSKLDLRNGFHQLELEPESRYVTTFSTHVGLWRYKRLNFGISAAPEIFQNEIRQALQGLRGVRNLSDDIIVFGSDQKTHDANLRAVLQRLREKNLTLNKEKCSFNQNKISFFGYVFSAEGISADPKKVEAIKDAKKPSNQSEIKSFLGMTNYVSRFIPDYSTITEPLRKLLRDKTPWKWTSEQDDAFHPVRAHVGGFGYVSKGVSVPKRAVDGRSEFKFYL
ncbi:hypothetical protein FSP39_008092 [Pinctada imbricata]|uniref:Reverse transcriptase domain-containing protein n=1 Tax=Pinctada imbricata TaxID=66713 RepID=A0AA88YI00_PINIB|nr:hypothetical protein FSP39_008092 [Pinctada imbricata]